MTTDTLYAVFDALVRHGVLLEGMLLKPNMVIAGKKCARQEAVKTVALPGDQLRQLCEAEHEVGYHIMRQLASALSRRLLATRLQLLDLFGEHVPALEFTPNFGRPGDPEC